MGNPIKTLLRGQDGSPLSQYLSALSACIALFTAGIHLAWPTPFLKILLSPEYRFRISEDEASYIVIISCLGHMIGGITAPTLADIIGRKSTLLCAGIPQLTSLILIYISYKSKYLLYTARVLGGIGEGASLAVVPIYIAEISEPRIRGLLGTCTSLIFIFGMLFVNLVGSYSDIYTTALLSMSFPVIFWLVFMNFPETPYYYLMEENTEDATETLRILRRKNSVWKEVESLSEDVHRQMSESSRYKDLFTVPSNRKALIIIFAGRFFQQFTGCSAYGLYSQLLVPKATNVHPVLGSCILMSTQIVTILFSSFVVDRLGRRPLLILSAGLSSIVLFIQGTIATVKAYGNVDLSHIHWLPLAIMVCLLVCHTLGLGIVVNILMSELFSSNVKAKAISLGSVVYAITLMASTKYYQYTVDNLGLHVTFYTFAVCSSVGAVFFYIVLPETKGKTLEDIQQDLKRKFKLKKRSKEYSSKVVF